LKISFENKNVSSYISHLLFPHFNRQGIPMTIYSLTKKIYIKDELPSDLRKTIKLLQQSREEWKERNREKNERIKALKVRLQETKDSRNKIKAEKKEYLRQLKASLEEVENLKSELAKLSREKEESLDKHKKKLLTSLHCLSKQ
jgi:chromosome segregation ATPase